MAATLKLFKQLTSDEVEALWRQARAEGLLSVFGADVDMDLVTFWDVARLSLVFCAGYDPCGEPVGFFLLTNVEGETARLHFCLFKAGREARHELGRQALEWIFDNFSFQCLRGVVPVINRGAAEFAREVGGRELGIIPGYCWLRRRERGVGGIVFIFERSLYRGEVLDAENA